MKTVFQNFFVNKMVRKKTVRVAGENKSIKNIKGLAINALSGLRFKHLVGAIVCYKFYSLKSSISNFSVVPPVVRDSGSYVKEKVSYAADKIYNVEYRQTASKAAEKVSDCAVSTGSYTKDKMSSVIHTVYNADYKKRGLQVAGAVSSIYGYTTYGVKCAKEYFFPPKDD